VGDKDDGSTKKLAGLRQFGGDVFGVPDSVVPRGARESGHVLE
jgi:hypothetical protein